MPRGPIAIPAVRRSATGADVADHTNSPRHRRDRASSPGADGPRPVVARNVEKRLKKRRADRRSDARSSFERRHKVGVAARDGDDHALHPDPWRCMNASPAQGVGAETSATSVMTSPMVSPARSAADPRSTRTTSAPIFVRARKVRPSDRLAGGAAGAFATNATSRTSPRRRTRRLSVSPTERRAIAHVPLWPSGERPTVNRFDDVANHQLLVARAVRVNPNHDHTHGRGGH